MKKIRATRHNGRSGKAGHNDRSFNVENARHIEEERCSKNVYWDCYQGFNIADEKHNRASACGVETEPIEAKGGSLYEVQLLLRGTS